jgi:hypothetical protein
MLKFAKHYYNVWVRNLIALFFGVGLIWSMLPIAANAAPILAQSNDQSAPQPMTEADLAKLNDPLFQLVLKDHAEVKTLADVTKFLKPTTQNIFVVDEHIVDSATKVGDRTAERRSVVTYSGTTNQQILDQNVLLSVTFDPNQFPEPNFIEAMAWDDGRGQFNYYKLNRTTGETTPTWKFRGNSQNADLSTNRQGTCMQCHINGGTVMKELLLPWNNWDSFSAKTPYLLKGTNSWPIANAANSPLAKLAGAENLESETMFPAMTRFNTRRINALKGADNQTITDAKRLLKPLFVTTEFNLISSNHLSPLHPFSKASGSSGDIRVPTSFFINQRLLEDLEISAPFFDFAKLDTKDYEHLLRQTKTGLADKVPGDTNFAWLTPEPSFIDNDLVHQLMAQKILPPAFLAAALAVDLERPVLSIDRAKLWSDKILPAQFKFGATNDLIPQVVKNLTALNPAVGTPEATFLQMLRQPDAVKALKQKVDQYVGRERGLLAGAKLGDRSTEWIRLYKLALQRREALLNDGILKSLDETGGKLLLARGDIAATVSPLPSTTAKPRPTLRRGNQGEDVVFLQQRLKALGLFSGVVDGDFGPQTESAVIAAQRKFGLAADGEVGPATWAALQR